MTPLSTDSSSDAPRNLAHATGSTSLAPELPAAFSMIRFTSAEAPGLFTGVMALRVEVFVKEQQVPEEMEPDEYDEAAVHWIIRDVATGLAVSTGRLVAWQEGCQTRPVAKIGRMAVHKAYRGRQLGAHLLRAIIADARESGFEQAILNAQEQALPFYEQFGFVGEGDPFDEAGISHRAMRLLLE